ncbi:MULTISPECIES: SH3 domain-containing protein [Pseudomonas]|uniref:SH3 domain-containing protein n=1 Tax=Pseudomonas TaxID=286 RepID=UPI0005C4145A|nr:MULTISPECIES: SH3 domain-containing protein [Pseudomonas]AJP52202.1 hypothetical protein PF1751_v1c25020 [Pseudomonas simiae]
MRKKSQSWFFPLLILFVVLWAIGKKENPSTQAQPSAVTTPTSLASPTAIASPTPPSPIELYVSADKLNIRDQPSGKVISKLQRGAKVQVYEKANDWVRISIDGQPARWLSSKNLCSGSNCFAKAQPRPVPTAPQPAYKPSREFSSSCPCSSGNVCIGPRGGRYCITSGGKKRYGV